MGKMMTTPNSQHTSNLPTHWNGFDFRNIYKSFIAYAQHVYILRFLHCFFFRLPIKINLNTTHKNYARLLRRLKLKLQVLKTLTVDRIKYSAVCRNVENGFFVRIHVVFCEPNCRFFVVCQNEKQIISIQNTNY